MYVGVGGGRGWKGVILPSSIHPSIYIQPSIHLSIHPSINSHENPSISFSYQFITYILTHIPGPSRHTRSTVPPHHVFWTHCFACLQHHVIIRVTMTQIFAPLKISLLVFFFGDLNLCMYVFWTLPPLMLFNTTSNNALSFSMNVQHHHYLMTTLSFFLDAKAAFPFIVIF